MLSLASRTERASEGEECVKIKIVVSFCYLCKQKSDRSSECVCMQGKDLHIFSCEGKQLSLLQCVTNIRV